MTTPDGARLLVSVDDLRSALDWSAQRPDCRDDAHLVALCLARLQFERGRLGEAQQRYEQAADLADGELARAEALTQAAAVAKCRITGDEALRLDRAAAETFVIAGDEVAAAGAFARAAELIARFRGMFADLPPAQTRLTLVATAHAYGRGDPSAERAALVAEAHADDLDDPPASKPSVAPPTVPALLAIHDLRARPSTP